MCQEAFGDQRQRIGTSRRLRDLRLVARRKRSGRNVNRIYTILFRQGQIRHCRFQRLQHQHAGFGGKPGLQHQRPILIERVGDRTARLLPRFPRQLLDLEHAPILPHQLFHVACRAMQCDRQQILFRRRRCDAGELAHLGVAQLAATHGRADPRQLLQRMGHAHLLPCHAQGDAALPVEPVRAGLRHRIRPTLAAIELRNHRQPAAVGGVEVPHQLGDGGGQIAIGKALERVRRMAVHGTLR